MVLMCMTDLYDCTLSMGDDLAPPIARRDTRLSSPSPVSHVLPSIRVSATTFQGFEKVEMDKFIAVKT